MRITVRRTGGFAGIGRTFDVDTAQLSPARAREIERLAKAVREHPLAAPFDSAQGRRRPPPADSFAYEVTIDGQTTTVDDAEALIEAITA